MTKKLKFDFRLRLANISCSIISSLHYVWLGNTCFLLVLSISSDILTYLNPTFQFYNHFKEAIQRIGIPCSSRSRAYFTTPRNPVHRHQAWRILYHESNSEVNEGAFYRKSWIQKGDTPFKRHEHIFSLSLILRSTLEWNTVQASWRILLHDWCYYSCKVYLYC